MKWDMNTNLQAVFELLLEVLHSDTLPAASQPASLAYAAAAQHNHMLEVNKGELMHVGCGMQRAVQAKLAPKDMIKSLFIFSDMEFDEAVSKRWNYSQNSGFEHVPPLPEDPTNFEAIKVCFPES